MPTLVPLRRPSAVPRRARLYSRARRNLLPRHERLVAVAGRWQHAHLRPPRRRARGHPAVRRRAVRRDVRDLREDPRPPAPRPLGTRPAVGRPAARLDAGRGAAPRRAAAAGGRRDRVRRQPRHPRPHRRRGRRRRAGAHQRHLPADPPEGVRGQPRHGAHPADGRVRIGREARRDLAAAGFTAYVADPAAATPYLDVDYAHQKVAIVVGSEGDGVAPEWRTPDLTRVSIPMRGTADSLNVAASASILLFDARARLR